MTTTKAETAIDQEKSRSSRCCRRTASCSTGRRADAMTESPSHSPINTGADTASIDWRARAEQLHAALGDVVSFVEDYLNRRDVGKHRDTDGLSLAVERAKRTVRDLNMEDV